MRVFECAGTLLLCLPGSMAAQDAAERLLSEANSAYRTLHASEAVDLYRKYLATYGDRADVRVYLGGALLNLNRTQDAIDEAQRAISLDARYGKGYILAGRVHAAREQWDAAQQSFARAQTLDPHDLDAWYFSGRAYYDANRFEPSIQAFDQALRIDPNQARIHENLGLAQDALGRFDAAEKSFRKSVELADVSESKLWRPYFVYGAFLFRQSRPAEGLPLLRQALTIAPEVVEIRFELARLLYHQDNTTEAAQILDPALASNECRVHNLMARIFSARGEGRRAEVEIKALANCKTGSARE
jgi:tetratricopeptide (TPR) repeat protein